VLLLNRLRTEKVATISFGKVRALIVNHTITVFATAANITLPATAPNATILTHHTPVGKCASVRADVTISRSRLETTDLYATLFPIDTAGRCFGVFGIIRAQRFNFCNSAKCAAVKRSNSLVLNDEWRYTIRNATSI
jgi:hypothetical protein